MTNGEIEAGGGGRGGDGQIPQPAAALGYAGALPVVILAVLVWAGSDAVAAFALPTLIQLTTIILAFMGGVRWGIAMAGPAGPRFGPLIVSILPALIAWPVMVIENRVVQMALLVMAFAGLLVSDLRATRRGEAPAWYPGLRVPLTVLVVGSLGACLARVLTL
ncbi:MAG: DUF3429 domain-containing protein [Alphaproteobacteria bacterium]|nr:DUF3429 domain-containing protein [Alphaproteobacteria bacterium]